MNHDPETWPSMERALQTWRKIKAALSTLTARWRLRKLDESVGERVILDTIAVAKQGIQSVTHLFNCFLSYKHELIFSLVADLVAGFNAIRMDSLTTLCDRRSFSSIPI